MKLRFFPLVLLGLLVSAVHVRSQNAPRACPIYTAHEIHDGILPVEAGKVESVDCRGAVVPWKNLSMTLERDYRYASIAFAERNRSECLRFSDFDLNVPPGAQIHGIEVEFYGHHTGSSVLTTSVYLLDDEGQQVGKNQAAWVKGDDWPVGMSGVDGRWYYGAPNETWGAHLTSDIVNDPDFGFEVQLRKPMGTDTSGAFLDLVRMTVYFLPVPTICHDTCTVFYVDSIPEARSFHWDLPQDVDFVSLDTTTNIVLLNVERLALGLHEICVTTESDQGLSLPCCSVFRIAPCGTGSIGDYLWVDENENGVQDTSEIGMGGRPVHLIEAFSGAEIQMAVTDSTGHYLFQNVPEGHYYIQVDLPGGWSTTRYLASTNDEEDNDFNNINGPNTSRTFFLGSGQNLLTMDGGFISSTSVGDFVWRDDNGNGLQDSGERGIPDVRVILYNFRGQIMDTTYTDVWGFYRFDHVQESRYRLRFFMPAGMIPTQKDVGVNEGLDSDIDNFGWSVFFDVNMGQQVLNMDAGFVPMGSLCGQTWYDRNADGLRDSLDLFIDSMEVVLRDTSGLILGRRWTDGQGGYCFDSLPLGVYDVHFLLDSGFYFSPRDVGTDDFIDSDVDDMGHKTVVLDAAHTFALVDAGKKMICSAAAPVIGVDQNLPCYQGGTYLVDVNTSIAGVIPQGYDLIYLLVDGVDQSIIAGSNVPVFSIPMGGTYEVYSLVYMPDPRHPEYLDIADLINRGDDILKVQWALDDLYLCAGLYGPFLFNVADCATIHGVIWKDENQDGQRQSFEDMIDDVEVVLYDTQNNEVLRDTSDGNGVYVLNRLNPGNYFMEVVLSGSRTPTLMDVGSDLTDSDIDSDGRSDMIFLQAGQTQQIDAGLIEDCHLELGHLDQISIDDTCWSGQPLVLMAEELDRGIFPSSHQLKYLLSRDGWIYDTASQPRFEIDSFGIYCIHALISPSDTADTGYVDLDEILQAAYTVDEVYDLTHEPDRCAKFDYDGLCLEVFPCALLGDQVWFDTNENGLQDVGEPGINDLTVRLFTQAGQQVASTTTKQINGIDGRYEFDKVKPGEYYLQFEITAALEPTLPNVGGDDSLDSDLEESNGAGTTSTFVVHGGDNLDWDAGMRAKGVNLGNFVWDDTNANGLQDVGEPGINDVMVYLVRPDGVRIDSTLTTDAPLTSASGYYVFESIPPGDYYLVFGEVLDKVQTQAHIGADEDMDSDVDNGFEFGSTDLITLVSGTDRYDVDAGYIDPSLLLSRVGDYIWLDRDNDGIQDAFENGMNGVKVELFDNDDILLSTTFSANHPHFFTPGYYEFTDIKAGQYYLVFTPPVGYEFANSFAGFDNEKDSDISNVKTYGSTNVFGLYAGEEKMSIDAGFVQYGSLGDRVWFDENGDGIQNDNEQGMDNVSIDLYDKDNNLIASTLSYDDPVYGKGYYLFADIDPTGYYLRVDLPSGYAFTDPNVGGDDTRDSDINHSNGFGSSSIIHISPGEHDRDADIGLQKQGIIGRSTWMDTNNNGLMDAGETGVAGVKVFIYNLQDSMYFETSTDTLGNYQLDKLPKGSYYLRFVPPAQYDFTTSGHGSEDRDSDVTHAHGYGTTDVMSLASGQTYLMLDAGLVNQVALAVNIIDFQVKNEGGMVDVLWAVAQEDEVMHYVLERKGPNETQFEEVTTVVPQVASLGRYQWTDHVLLAGIYQYRLRVVHQDGEVLLSLIRSIQNDPGISSVRIYPNPASQYLYIECFGMMEEEAMEVDIRSIEGGQMRVAQMSGGQARIRVEDWPVGLYTVLIKSSGRVLSREKVAIIR